MTPETKFKNKVIKYLDSINAYHIPYVPTMYSPSGIPDRYCCINGISFWIEFKAQKGKLSKIQVYQIELMKSHQILVHVLHPEDFEDFKWFCENLMTKEV